VGFPIIFCLKGWEIKECAEKLRGIVETATDAIITLVVLQNQENFSSDYIV